jgi:tripartite-type tricarboxylate transporter receptor subunit TctC
MKTISRRTFAQAGALTALLLSPTVFAQANGFPDKPVRVIVPFAAGNVLDNALRQVGEEFKKDTGQPLIIESKPGGGGIIAAQAVANAAPDGYTLLLASVSMMTVNPHLQQAALRPAQELSPDHRVLRLIAGDGRQRQRAGQQHQGIRRMGQGAKRPVSFASFTAGNTSHFMGVILNKRTGLDLVHVPFNGTPPAVQNLVGQQVDAAFLPLIAVKPQVEAGKVKVLAVSTPERSPIMPNVPTFKEQGYPDLTIHIWSSLARPPARRTRWSTSSTPRSPRSCASPRCAPNGPNWTACPCR